MPTQKMASKTFQTIPTLIRGKAQFDKKLNRKHQKRMMERKRSGFVYFDHRHEEFKQEKSSQSVPSTPQQQIIEPSSIHRINPTICNTFLSMHEVDPLDKNSKKSRSWPLLKKKSTPNNNRCHRQLKEINDINTFHQILSVEHITTTDNSTKPEYSYYFDDEEEEKKHFYKSLNLEFSDVFKEKQKKSASSTLDIVLNHATDNKLPYNIDQYFILLYYNIKQSTFYSLQEIWTKLYKLFEMKLKNQHLSLPTIFMDFGDESGEPININHVFEMLYMPQLNKFDINTLRDVVKQYFYQWHPKCITDVDRDSFYYKINTKKINDQFIPIETAQDEHREYLTFNSLQNWSIGDGSSFALLELADFDHEEEEEQTESAALFEGDEYYNFIGRRYQNSLFNPYHNAIPVAAGPVGLGGYISTAIIGYYDAEKENTRNET